ncbi:ABC transporter ATP-binding protein [Mesoplasma lactucae]|uniref:ABC transporter ATP-binding protein n=1 Tax=Mesoplasma lactucae ATCC 49193 TaxID=81460 RepID=A0A291IR29_9MOLU|nr:ABC transporter ATP-binding protein [Mesoplasma lactucae]ATG97322.1 ABC transporter ATP-binding protein [Mesoplasma lactucae ATCC 49193]ATZ20227.1 ABC transporter ATP-binding protein [Mesoplasma lactucae ATCC 49193]MCL8216976.1 putative multidrug export ATP-binding/permease protein [Mesoplasma lactucae ATCC 49193]
MDNQTATKTVPSGKTTSKVTDKYKGGAKNHKSDKQFTWGKMSSFLKIVMTNAKQNKALFITMVLVTIANAVFSTLAPLAASQMVAALIDTKTQTYFGAIAMTWWGWIIVTVAVLIVQAIFEYATDYTIGIFSMKVEIQQRLAILDSLVDQDLDFFFDHVSGNILTRLVGDTQGLALGIQQFLTNVIFLVAAVISAAVILFTKNAMLTGIALGYIIVVLLIGFIIFVYFRRALIYMFDIKRDIDTDMTDRINNITLIKSSGTEVEEIQRNAEQNEVYSKAGNKQVVLSVCLNVWIYIANAFLPTIILLIAIAHYQNDTHQLIITITTFLPNVGMLSLPIVMMIQTLRAATRASNCADRIGQLTDPKPTILPNTDGKKIDHIDDVIFDKVTFAYPQDKTNIIIPETNLTLEKGKSYAFVGETGSGKSTIGRLLLRLYDPTSGKILINNTDDLKKINLPTYLSKVGYVEQNPQMFYGNFWDNIGYGCFNATHDEIIAAAKKANLHDFIMSLPEGYETILGERGFLLSGGQKQRLVIARVFLKDPDLIILDEATSALDNIVEKEIQEELDKLVADKTSVTIAHRLSTIKNVDEIFVLEPKKGITQKGTFDELKTQPGHFKELYEAGLMD